MMPDIRNHFLSFTDGIISIIFTCIFFGLLCLEHIGVVRWTDEF